MPWGRIDDGLYDHPKVEALGRDRLAGVGLWALAISWCNRRLTDGVVPADRIRALGGTTSLASRLIEVGLFERHPDGYLIHDFLEFNDSAEQVQARRQAAAERQRKRRTDRDVTAPSQRESRGESQRSHSVTDSEVTPMSQRESRPSRAGAQPPAGPRPDPTRTRPTESSLPEEDRSSSLPGGAERWDVAALRSWGWKRVTPKQLAVLDEIADRHDRPSKGEAWGQWAAGIIAATPDGTDPIAHLRAEDARWQAERRVELDAEEARLAAEKAAYLAAPVRPLAELLAEGLRAAGEEPADNWFGAEVRR